MSARSWQEQLAEWEVWLDNNLDNPALIAGCARVGRRLAEGLK